VLRSPIYREIDQSVTLWGLEPEDVVVLATVGYLVGVLTSQLHLRVGPIDATLLASCIGIAALFSSWLYFRRGKPRHYAYDLVHAASEPDVWIVTADLQARPVMRGA
jgi:hypothetical protein